MPILLLGIFDNSKLKYPYFIWMRLGYCLGWINSRIILGIVFFIILLPISLIMKIFGYDPIRLKKKKENSYKIAKTGKTELNKIF